MKELLTIPYLLAKAEEYCAIESQLENPLFYGITDGKAVGTYVEHAFQKFLLDAYEASIEVHLIL